MVGTKLAEIIESHNYMNLLSKGSGCGCQDMQKKMDSWGVEGCQRKKQAIVDHLCSQAKKRFKVVPFARAVASLWVQQAIDLSKRD